MGNIEEYVDEAIRKCLNSEYWGFKLIHIYYSDEQTYTKHKYGIFTKPKLRFREVLWEVSLKDWKRTYLNGKMYYRNQVIEADRNIWIIKDNEHKVIFYRA